MYEDYYGLIELPFNITPDPKFLYLSPSHQEAIQHLNYGISERKGFIVLIGEVGCGKTTLCRHFLNNLDHEQYDTALIMNPRMTETQLLRTILEELGETVVGRSCNDLISQVNKILLERINQGKDILLIVDECQNLSFEVLEQLRLLSNLETDKQKLLQIILMGQPEFKDMLSEPRLRQLRQRILVNYELKPLTFPQLEHYIRHRIALAGGLGRPQFSRWASRTIYRASQGIPRIINNLCDKALLASFCRQGDTVNFWDVRRALKEYNALSLT
ncbi:MAG: AAA family ATPase [Opitutaceae bacterium]|nr:AAA family ATPase [Opitutaceae bacterium]